MLELTIHTIRNKQFSKTRENVSAKPDIVSARNCQITIQHPQQTLRKSGHVQRDS